MLHKPGRLGLGVLGMLMMATVVLRGNGDPFSVGTRGRSLASVSKQSPKILHPKWMLWNEMIPAQKQKALKELSVFFRKYGKMIESEWMKHHIPDVRRCTILPDQEKEICDISHLQVNAEKPCSFMSFGVFGPAILEYAMAEMGCNGFTSNPAESKESMLHPPRVTYHNIGVSKLREETHHDDVALWNTTIPRIRKMFDMEYTDVLQLDCEGCELALTRDVIKEDPTFFHHFGQINVKVHASKSFVDKDEELYYMGLWLPLLEDYGLILTSSRVVRCKSTRESDQCVPKLDKWGYHCGKSGGVMVSRSCVEYLFANPEIARDHSAVTSSAKQ